MAHPTRCFWCGDDEQYVRYHDEEWGVPVHDDNALFELLTLESAQAGLSWLTVLRRREGYRRVFKNFDPALVARFSSSRIEKILTDEGVVRHRQKIVSTVNNARAILAVQHLHGSFDTYLWTLSAGNKDESARLMSAQLRKDGFAFVGPTICVSLMQASGMVNDHDQSCFRYREIEKLRHSKKAPNRT